MYQTFFTKTIESKFIKQLLYYSPIPIYKVVSDEEYIFKDNLYVYNNTIIKCTESGPLYLNYSDVAQYEFGVYYPQYTEKHVSEFGYYDPETHEYLGKYLRCLKKLYGLDLMPFYNCYSNRLANNFYIRKTFSDVDEDYQYKDFETYTIPCQDDFWVQDGSNWKTTVAITPLTHELSSYKATTSNSSASVEFTATSATITLGEKPTEDFTLTMTYYVHVDVAYPSYLLINEPNTDFKVMQIPIEFNQEYTIAIDSDAEVLMTPAVIANGRFVSIYDENKNKVDLTDVLNERTIAKSKTYFNKPFVYKLNLDTESTAAEYLHLNEGNLYLLIQVPITNTSSVVVLEGDYLKNEHCRKYYDYSLLTDFSTEHKNKILLSGLSLLKFNTKISFAFSDRLIEYLTLNVINHLEDIDMNIERIEKAQKLGSPHGITLGVWSDKVRKIYFELMMSNKSIEHYDLNGFIDKDTERQCVKE